MKRKIKKILVFIQTFSLSMVSKVFALSPDLIQPAYGVKRNPSPIEKAFSIGKFILPIILFVIGLFVIISKKITNKAKVIISSLIIVGIITLLILHFVTPIGEF